MQSITLIQKKTIILNHPCFTNLTETEGSELVSLFIETELSAGQDIVRQNELIDNIYFIAKGKAEVQRNEIINEQEQIEILSTLTEGEAIGLSNLGFYSKTGRRTATVTAITDILLLTIKLKVLQEFLNESPHINEFMQQSAEVMLRMQLIKKAAPFAKISMDNLYWLAQQITETRLTKDSVLLQKGEPGECCYLIQSGTIEIYIPNTDGSDTSIAKLTTPSVFGETAVLLNLPRTASARALEESHLLALDRHILEHITKIETHTASALENLVKLRNRPLRLPHIELHKQRTNDGEEIITLKNSQKNNYYRLQEEGLFVWNLLDGKHTFRDITLLFNREYQIFDSAMISEFIMDLEKHRFIESLTITEHKREEKAYSLTKTLAGIKKVMEASICFDNVDEWMTKTYNGGVRHLFNKFTLWLSITVMTLGFIFFIANFNYHIELFRHTAHSGWTLLAVILIMNFTVILHELAHGYMTKFFGKKVVNFGLGWYWVAPIAFCDTSDMWLAKKNQRLAVDFAGLFVDFTLAGFASLLALFATNPFLMIFLWLFAFYKYLLAYLNLDPILEFDGYYMLMDLSGQDNLRESSLMWLINLFQGKRKKMAKTKEHRWYKIYLFSCLAYISGSFIVNYYVINILLTGILSTSKPSLAYLLTLFAVTVALLTAWDKIKKEHNTMSLSE